LCWRSEIDVLTYKHRSAQFEINVTAPNVIKGFFILRNIDTCHATVEVVEQYHWDSTIENCLPLVREGIEKFNKEANCFYNADTCRDNYHKTVVAQADFSRNFHKVFTVFCVVVTVKEIANGVGQCDRS
jgi:hypothetical protein